MGNILKINNVSKRFNRKVVLENINLEIHSGEVVGLVGENGSGKTVLMKLMIGLMKPTAGSVEYNDLVLRKDINYFPSVGFIIETPGFYEDLDAFSNLKALASVKNIIDDEEIIKWIKLVGLKTNAQDVGEYSLGMLQRLGIAQALMENPDVIILDEPTNALDDEGVNLVHKLVQNEKNNGKIIIISSHSKYDIEELCGRVYRIKDGSLIIDEE